MPSAQTVLILDTGCGGASNNHCIGVKSLREFLETVAVEENERAPLNPGGQLAY